MTPEQIERQKRTINRLAYALSTHASRTAAYGCPGCADLLDELIISGDVDPVEAGIIEPGERR